jgi:hypothetical protein
VSEKQGKDEAPQPPSIGKPSVGPKHYVFRGYSGMPETFSRKEADAALQQVLGEIPLEGVADQIRAEGRALSQVIVRERLARLLGLTAAEAEKKIPLPAIVALWARGEG